MRQQFNNDKEMTSMHVPWFIAQVPDMGKTGVKVQGDLGAETNPHHVLASSYVAVHYGGGNKVTVHIGELLKELHALREKLQQVEKQEQT